MWLRGRAPGRDCPTLAMWMLLSMALTYAPTEYPPAQGCEAVLDGYCNRAKTEVGACRICPMEQKYGRLDYGVGDTPPSIKQWRCYCSSALDENNQHWDRKSDMSRQYCSRPKLAALFDDCVAGRISKAGYEVKEL